MTKTLDNVKVDIIELENKKGEKYHKLLISLKVKDKWIQVKDWYCDTTLLDIIEVLIEKDQE